MRLMKRRRWTSGSVRPTRSSRFAARLPDSVALSTRGCRFAARLPDSMVLS